MNDNYIGKKGYTIKKKNLTQTQMYELRKELTVKPNTGGGGYISNISYPIYRESENKLYIPRYYGIEKYGNVNKINISDGNNIHLDFEGNLYDYQINIINKTLNHFNDGGGGLLDVEPGKGKTVMALNLISKLKKKTLVVVHKTFLMNQWKERIQQFLPNATIGYIQGKTIDTDNKDIVIGMLQTLSTKEFSSDILNEFGFTIYDECHHLSAEVFSLVMIQINTKYTLGLSGTMTRKDGLTKVFKWFIGPVIHKEKTDNKQEVLIKTIQFEDPTNEEYNKVDTDYRGNPMYSRMITNICNNDNRTSMIINIIKHELKDTENVKQIMILAHNKSLINKLYEDIAVFDSSVGLYVGGMKEKELKESESKKIIIATYAMASEGLDIKTLTSLFMVTPKTDVCQSVGRILRTNHSRPLVIDIIDAHDIFKRQYSKRKKYYDKKKYKIYNYKNLTSYLNNEFVQNIKQSKSKCLI
uniref:Vv A18-Like Helicase n=1 Tax=Florenciella sp. virus SA2 TaxID=3240092 RepID=A0AB39J9N0_9VIRU